MSFFDDENVNLDVLKRLSNLEKVIYGSEKEDKE